MYIVYIYIHLQTETIGAYSHVNCAGFKTHLPCNERRMDAWSDVPEYLHETDILLLINCYM